MTGFSSGARSSGVVGLRRKLHGEPVEVVAEFDAAAETGGLGREIILDGPLQHVFFRIFHLYRFVVPSKL